LKILKSIKKLSFPRKLKSIYYGGFPFSWESYLELYKLVKIKGDSDNYRESDEES